MTKPKPDPRRGVPRAPLYFTLDQVAAMLALSEDQLAEAYVWFEGRDIGTYLLKYLRAVRFQTAQRPSYVTKRGSGPDWRIPEGELIRWLHHNKLWVYDPLSDIELFEQPVPPALNRALTTPSPQSRSLPPRHTRAL